MIRFLNSTILFVMLLIISTSFSAGEQEGKKKKGLIKKIAAVFKPDLKSSPSRQKRGSLRLKKVNSEENLPSMGVKNNSIGAFLLFDQKIAKRNWGENRPRRVETKFFQSSERNINKSTLDTQLRRYQSYLTVKEAAECTTMIKNRKELSRVLQSYKQDLDLQALKVELKKLAHEQKELDYKRRELELRKKELNKKQKSLDVQGEINLKTKHETYRKRKSSSKASLQRRWSEMPPKFKELDLQERGSNE